MTLVGVPEKSDLFGIHPPTSYLDEEDKMTNLRSVVEILHEAKVEIRDELYFPESIRSYKMT